MIEGLVAGVFLFSTLLFLSLYLVQVKKNRSILANTLKLLLNQELENQSNKTDKEKSNEDFLKFISDSREWAYNYIESVQEKVNKFISDVEPEIAYFDEYGVASSTYPHYHSMKKISGAYKELKTILPDDYGKIE
jgi:hypothetical protein